MLGVELWYLKISMLKSQFSLNQNVALFRNKVMAIVMSNRKSSYYSGKNL